MDANLLEQTNSLLKVIVALLVRGKSEEAPTLRQQVKVLSDLGVRPSDIASILGRTNSYVTKELAGIRKNQTK